MSASDTIDANGVKTVMALASVDLNLLVAFDALMAERSVTRAAQRMSVGQSAMSATLGRLRRLFDDALLVRQGRVLVTTPLAESLVGPVREALSLIEQTLAARSRFDPETDRRTFSIAASDYVTFVFLRQILARLAAEAPNVRLHLRPITAGLTDELHRGHIDLLIVPRDLLREDDDSHTIPLFDDRWVCAVDRNNPEVGTTISLDQFSTQPYLSYSAASLPSLVERQLDTAGIARNRQVTVETFMVAAALLPGTRFITIIQERLANVVRDRLGLRLLDPPMPLRPVTEVMAWTWRQEHDPAHVWLRGRLRALAPQV